LGRWLAVFLLAAVVHLTGTPGRADPDPGTPTIRLTRSNDPGTAFEVIGLGRDASLPGILTVHTVNGSSDLPPLLGTTTVENGVLRFQPRFPLEPGLRYCAKLALPDRKPVTAEFSVGKPTRAAAATSVTHVFPTRDVLPENQLKFYIEFSAPMAQGEAYQHIHLLDAAGKPVKWPFLELGEELWDPRGVRFTLFFDPGRIKVGLQPREELGPVLEAGKSYTLLIDRAWRDAQGEPLRSEFRKTFRAGPADGTSPDPKTWKLDPPAAGTRAALVARFPEPLDRAMLQRVLTVADASGKPLAGSVAVGAGETSWSFTPDAPWKGGNYDLVVDTSLEDLAGNSIERPFEVDVFDKVDRTVKAKTITQRFTVTPAPAGREQRERGPAGGGDSLGVALGPRRAGRLGPAPVARLSGDEIRAAAPEHLAGFGRWFEPAESQQDERGVERLGRSVRVRSPAAVRRLASAEPVDSATPQLRERRIGLFALPRDRHERHSGVNGACDRPRQQQALAAGNPLAELGGIDGPESGNRAQCRQRPAIRGG
jgi:hypothetical protein